MKCGKIKVKFVSRKFKRVLIFLAIILFFIIFFTSAFYKRKEYMGFYNKGVSLLEEGKYSEALDSFSEIPDYIRYQDIAELLDKYDIQVCPYCGSVIDDRIKN